MKRETLGSRVAQLRREKAARERRDISQKEVAAELGVSGPVVSETESGKTYPSKATLGKFARYYGVSEVFLEYGIQSGEIPEVMRNARKLTEEQLDRADAMAERATKSEPKPKPTTKPRRVGGKKR